MFKIVNAVFDENSKTILFSDGNQRQASPDEEKWFRNRRLKAVEQDGQYRLIRFADLHRHSEYSLLDGCIRIGDMEKHTDFCGAITDHGNMYGALSYYKTMKKAGKLPIIGEEFYCEDRNGEKHGNHLILLAKNQVGYQNLIKLSSMAFQNFYRKPHISYSMLEEYHEGLICMSACLAGELSQIMIKSENREEANRELQKVVSWFQKVFGDDYYIEIQRHGIDDEVLVNPWLIQLAHDNGIKLVATTDAHYVDKDDEEVHDAVLCIGTKTTFSDESRMRFAGTGYHLHTADEVDELFREIPEALDTTLEIMEKCNAVEIETGKHYLPDYPIPVGFENEYAYLEHVAKMGFEERFSNRFAQSPHDTEAVRAKKESDKKEYWDRWLFEMDIIKKMGFAGYFLVVWDFLKFARENDIPTGPGRGSGAGSLVLYCLHITDFDPIQYGLLFERFLNPDRISLPDCIA